MTDSDWQGALTDSDQKLHKSLNQNVKKTNLLDEKGNVTLKINAVMRPSWGSQERGMSGRGGWERSSNTRLEFPSHVSVFIWTEAFFLRFLYSISSVHQLGFLFCPFCPRYSALVTVAQAASSRLAGAVPGDDSLIAK